MRKLNIAKGLIASKLYLNKLEASINVAYDTPLILQNAKLKDLEYFEEEFISNISKRFNNLEIHSIDESIKKEAYQTIMQSDSSRTRPLLLFLGNMCGSECVDKNVLVSNGIAIELIHKMSLIIDDYFDNDLLRKGKPTFHTIYDECTIIDTISFLLKLSNTLFQNSIRHLTVNQQRKLIELYKQIIIDMGTGFIEDLDRDERFISLKDVYRINDLQSTTMVRNSLLIGYSLSNRITKVDNTYTILQNVGDKLGKTFQGFNDIENFLTGESQTNNKNNLYSDLKENRKNIILGQIPKELFYPPYTNEDIIEYINKQRLIDTTVEELSKEINIIKQNILQLSQPVARDTLLFATNKIAKKSLKIVMNNK